MRPFVHAKLFVLVVGAATCACAYAQGGVGLRADQPPTLNPPPVPAPPPAPDFAAENPLQVGLSLGGFAYMAVSLLYVGSIMLLMARPIMRYFLWRVLGVESEIAVLLPVVIGVTVSIALAVFPLLAAEKRLAGRSG